MEETGRPNNRSFARFAWAVLALNLLVVAWGAYVRATGSGAGCGNHWPTCNGEVLPRSAETKTLIEFSHRLSSGLALIAVAAQLVWALRRYPRGSRVRLGAALCGVFILTEALIGAALVLLHHVADNQSVARGISLSLHLVNTFTLLALLALTAWWASGGAAPRKDPAFRALLASVLVALVVLGISGGIAALGDTLFPVTSFASGVVQDFSPSAHLFVRLRVFHPAIAVVVSVLTIGAAGFVMKRSTSPRIQTLGLAVIGLVFVQLAAGALNLALLAPVWMQLVHLVLADLVWVAAILFVVEAFSHDRVRRFA